MVIEDLLRARLPGLTLPRIPLGQLPTPVQPLELPDLGASRVWVKREDLSGTLYGGNKVRKLEWILPEALRQGGHMLSMGAVGSNYLVAAGLHGAQHGVKVHALLFPQPDSPTARGNARAIAATAASWRALPSSNLLPFAAILRSWSLRRELGFWPLSVGPGGSSPLGTVGWVLAALEIAEQVRLKEMPAPDAVYGALGSGGMIAGLLLGFSMTGLPTQVVGVGVTEPIVANRYVVMAIARRCARLLRAAGAQVPDPDLRRLRIEGGALGTGYGHPTEQGARATLEAAEQGLKMEPTYTAKALAACLGAARHSEIPKQLLFVHSFSACKPEVSDSETPLPERMESLLLKPQLLGGPKVHASS